MKTKTELTTCVEHHHRYYLTYPVSSFASLLCCYVVGLLFRSPNVCHNTDTYNHFHSRAASSTAAEPSRHRARLPLHTVRRQHLVRPDVVPPQPSLTTHSSPDTYRGIYLGMAGARADGGGAHFSIRSLSEHPPGCDLFCSGVGANGIAPAAFHGGGGLTAVVPPEDPTEMGDTAVLHSGVLAAPDGVTKMCSDAFQGCSGLISCHSSRRCHSHWDLCAFDRLHAPLPLPIFPAVSPTSPKLASYFSSVDRHCQDRHRPWNGRLLRLL